MKRITTLISVLILATSCIASPSSKEVKSTNEVKTNSSKGIYTPPQIPAMLSTTKQRIEFYTSHYWDDFNFRDTVLLKNNGYVEQAWSNYIAALPQLPYKEASNSLKETMSRASVDSVALETFIDISEKYLYDPNSPMRNDEYFIPILEYIITSDKVDDIMKLRPIELLKLAKKNRIGAQANDFKYTLDNGTSHSLYSINADFTLIFFNNPDCEDCKRVKDIISQSELLSSLTNQHGTQGKRLTILSIYPDEDLSLWHKATYPDIVINSYDAGCKINNDQLYDLKAIPSLYLLDIEKRVILKDAPIEIIENWLQNFAK